MVQESLPDWVVKSPRRVELLRSLTQPLTVHQLARRAGVRPSYCSSLLQGLVRRGCVECLTPDASSCRVYWFTALGQSLRQKNGSEPDGDSALCSFPEVDWALLSFVSHRHRSAILRALREPMQPADMKRKAKHLFPDLRMSSNNARDVVRLFRRRGIVEPVPEGKKAYPKYCLTPVGENLRTLLLNAEARD